ncbi:LysM peptidoglycan-binding domain-containing protein [Dactylosporangium sp. NPDC000555]|uniref:LysM peptidoglycan-binding domain-containing protein n=1 Tax=Dactylosporangium sp. NPDC000555 TaxID=3154260 RepID=UPI00331A809E
MSQAALAGLAADGTSLANPLTLPTIVLAAAGVGWLLWAWLACAIIGEIVNHVRGIAGLGHIRLPVPVHTAVNRLAGSIVLLTTTQGVHATGAAQPHAPADANQFVPVASTETVVPASTRWIPVAAPVLANPQANTYTVRRGDTLSGIAAQTLGDEARWPQICELNWHRHWPTVGGTLKDCNVIYPGWELRLPTNEAAPSGSPSDAAPQDPESATASSDPPSAAPSSPATPATTAAPTTSPAPATSSYPVITPSTTDSPTSPANGTHKEHAASPSTDGDGVRMPGGGFVTWALAAAISAATAAVWLQRRRRFVPADGGNEDDPPVPPAVLELHRHVIGNPELPAAADLAERAAAAPLLPLLPPGGVGLVGDGAHAAARAMLVAVLASGGPNHPDARGEVVIDAATLATLLGSETVTHGPWPRLHMADSIDDALTVVESRLLYRSRILDEHALTDLDELRQVVPDEEALPQIMLITETPPAGARMRTKVALGLGEGLHVSALLLGEWAHGATVKVTPDGHTKLVSGQAATPVPPRLPVLDPDTAAQILTTLREAQTGEPPAIASPAVPVTDVPLHASRTEPAPTDIPTPVAITPATASGRARLRVLGPPRIENITAEGRPLRAKAIEMAVYLAVHPDGAATRQIGEYLEPDARVHQADQRVHTNASNLRHVLGRAGTADSKNAYVIKSAGRYRLDPATVDVDVWTLRDLMRTATLATGPRRRELLTEACDLYTAPLAEGQDYEWLAPHRETVRRWGTEAHLLLADDLLDSNPPLTSDLLDKAIGLDRYNEALYVNAMHARHALGDADGIRTLLRALTKALADLDAEPQEDTIALATRLRNSLDET